ncbi:hypothetical protein ANCCAN_18976, partial [Ancylostoma caninum]
LVLPPSPPPSPTHPLVPTSISHIIYRSSRKTTISIDTATGKDVLEDDSYDSESEEEYGRRLSCSWLPCCMNEEETEAFGHHVSIFMVALVAFATFFCVTLILVLVFLLG